MSIPKSDVSTIVAAFAVVSGIVLTASQMPASEVIIGAGLGWLFRSAVKQKWFYEWNNFGINCNYGIYCFTT